MPALPWLTIHDADPDAEYTVMASRLPLRSHRHIPRFLRATMKIRRQLAAADGLAGYSLNAQLFAKTFWTLSAWDSQQALRAFSHANPHEDQVGGIRPTMLPSTFVFWTVRGSELPVSWQTARERITAARPDAPAGPAA